MPKVSITRIHVNPDRQREDIGDIEELANSIEKFGQLQPVVLDNQCNLIAGFRRLSACVALGHDTVNAEFIEQMDKVLAQEIELEENIRRKQLSWQEEAKAVDKIHKMKMETDPTWTADKTAAMLGKSRRTVFNSLELSKAIDTDDEVKAADTAHGAALRLKRKKEFTKRIEDAKVRKLHEDMGLSEAVKVAVHCADAAEWLKSQEADSFDMAISNPPFNVDIEGIFRGNRTIYEDKTEEVREACRNVCQEVFRVLKPDRWFVWFFPDTLSGDYTDMLLSAGFTFQKVPCIWYKPNKILSNMSDPYSNFPIQHETFVWARKGKPMLNRVRMSNVFVYDTPATSDRMHPLQMPVDLWREIVELGTTEGETVVEPFCGSGSGAVACIRSRRNYQGAELSRDYADRAGAWISEELTGKQSVDASAKSAQVDELASDLDFSI